MCTMLILIQPKICEFYSTLTHHGWAGIFSLIPKVSFGVALLTGLLVGVLTNGVWHYA